jgi:hypothetical protein
MLRRGRAQLGDSAQKQVTYASHTDASHFLYKGVAKQHEVGLVVINLTRITAAHRKLCPALLLQHLPAKPSCCIDDNISRSRICLLLIDPLLSPVANGEELVSYRHTKNFGHKHDAATATFVMHESLLSTLLRSTL